MGQQVSTVGGAIATAATSVAGGVTLGQVDDLNNAVKDCASYTAKHAQETVVHHVGETAAMAVGTPATDAAAGLTCGQFEEIDKAVVGCASATAKSAGNADTAIVESVDEVSDAIPVLAHSKYIICYGIGQNEREGGL
ncbi:hypothetical protein KP509_25G065500 [Ceratopteris richardii]|uniref:Uncharacterized protein n=1 Tax=Ceratopteris richardii TaxID=49495 RepID=A0A8T2RTW1_CERRI|nr:hypothetical protein KP509_25G065500 [Ceratopteris richardii]